MEETAPCAVPFPLKFDNHVRFHKMLELKLKGWIFCLHPQHMVVNAPFALPTLASMEVLKAAIMFAFDDFQHDKAMSTSELYASNQQIGN